MAVRRNKGRMPGEGNQRTRLTTLQESLLHEADREVAVAIDGRSQTISVSQLLSRKLVQLAANGSVHAMSNAINELNVAQKLRQQKIEEEVDLGRRIKAQQQQIFDAARAKGADVDTVLPHPDDILVQEGVGFDIVGPIDASELAVVKRECDKRDAFILQAALEKRLGPDDKALKGGPPGTANEPSDSAALLIVHILNDALPKRFRKSDIQMAIELMRYDGTPKRELLKLAHRTWAYVERPQPRGWRLPPAEKLVTQMKRIAPVLMALHQEGKNGKVLSEQTIAARLQRALS